MTRAGLAATLALAAIAAAPAVAEVAGPPAPGADRQTPAARVAARYREVNGRRIVARPCRQPGGDEIVVCAPDAGETSPYRLPLPDERGPRSGALTRTGEVPSASAERGATAGRPACCGGDPPKTLETIGKLIKVAKGEDPN